MLKITIVRMNKKVEKKLKNRKKERMEKEGKIKPKKEMKMNERK